MDNVYVSMDVTILPNVRINRNCIIAAGSVVSSDIPENSIVAGNPAKVVGRFDSFVATRMLEKDRNVPFVNQALPEWLAKQKWNEFYSDRLRTEEDKVQSDESVALSNDVLRIEQKINEKLSAIIDGIDVTQEKGLVDHHILDSLGLLTVVSALEELFSCKIPFQSINVHNFNSSRNMALMIDGLSTENNEIKQIVQERTVGNHVPLVLQYEDTEKPVVQRILEHSIRTPENIAIIANEKETTYSELGDMILSISKWLKEKEIESGDTVVVQADHSDVCVASYYAVQLIGAILVPVETTAASDRIKEIAHETGSKLAICISDQNNDIEDIEIITYATIQTIDHLYRFDSRSEVVYPDIDMPCEMIFTTGTTGKSKGVLMTYRDDSLYANAVAKCVEMKSGNRFLLTTPLNHAGGLRRTHLMLANGCCIVYLNGLNNLAKYFEYIEKYEVTSLYLPPVALRIILSRTGNELAKYRDQIDWVYSSSSSLPAGDCITLGQLLPNTRLYNAYEASETPGVCAYNYNVDSPNKNCLGRPNDGIELAILSDNGEITNKPHVTGQICVKSKMNMLEYYGEPELTKSVFQDGWFVSNDLGWIDENGYLYISGRKGDVINLGGYKIAPTEVEEVALQSSLINECILIEESDSYGVPHLKLLIVTSDSKFDKKELLGYLTSKLEAYKLPRSIDVVEEIKKTFNGKIDRKAYR